MTEERWNECTNHHHGCACREHEWEERVATLKAELELVKSNYEYLKGDWNKTCELTKEHCPCPLGTSHITDGIPRLAERARRLEAEVERLKGETYCAYCGERFPLDAPQGTDLIGMHIKACPKHPMRVVEAERDELIAQVNQMQKASAND